MSLVVDVRFRLPSFALEVRFTAERGITVFFGPSASGKTLSLRLVAGLERAASGTIRSRDRVFDNANGTFVAAQRRGVGYAPQHAALWPHRTTREHLTALTTRGHADELLARVGLEKHASRKPTHLSGGERQRLALARALARSADMLLLDEPFSALDDASRAEMREVVRAEATRGAIVLFVTHDREEAGKLGDAFVVFRDGVGAEGAI